MQKLDNPTLLALWDEADFQAGELCREVGAGETDRDDYRSQLFHDAVFATMRQYDPNHQSHASAKTYGKRYIQYACHNLKRSHLRRIARVTWSDALGPVQLEEGEHFTRTDRGRYAVEGTDAVNPIELVPGDAGLGAWCLYEETEMEDLYAKLLRNLPGEYRDVVEALYAAHGNKESAYRSLRRNGYRRSRTSFYTTDVPKAQQMVEEFCRASR